MRKVLLLAVSVLAATAVLFGSVTPAHATPVKSRRTPCDPPSSTCSIRRFPLKGLVSRLKYEGYSNSDATYGASHSGANWTKRSC